MLPVDSILSLRRLANRAAVAAALLAAVTTASCKADDDGGSKTSSATPSTAIVEGTIFEVVSLDRNWQPPGGASPNPTPAPNSHFVRAVVRFTVQTGSQEVGGDQVGLETTDPVGSGQPFGTGGGLSIAVPRSCEHAGPVMVAAGHKSPPIPVCWQVVGRVGQRLTVDWLSNHGVQAKVSFP